ncbi:MAG: bifunctional folylpolyglutamate synthase/dihydrofolate synthase [Anaerolineae bacterium]
MSLSSYADALRYLYGFVDYERRPAGDPERYDLDRVRRLVQALGNPERRYRIVHVAGTKGKGSTCAMVESVLRAIGLRTGLYTQPHLHTFRERIRVAGRMISEEGFVKQLSALRLLVEETPGLTTYEIATALALRHFAQEGVEVAVVEVGLGGRLDATNVVMPAVSVLTRIGYDHTDILGTRLDQIAAEKAGIVKPGRPVVMAPQRPTADRTVARICRERGAPLTRVARLFSWQRQSWDLSGQDLDLSGPHGQALDGLRIPLLGEHQLENAATAVATCLGLAEEGAVLSEAGLRDGLASTIWPGRMEILSASPLLVVDGAHNVDSAQALARALSDYLASREISWILGFLTGHDPRAFFRGIFQLGGRAILTRSQHPRAVEPDRLAQIARSLGTRFEVVSSTATALDRALSVAGSRDLICATGSLSIVAEVRAAWLRSQGHPPAEDPADSPPGRAGQPL